MKQVIFWVICLVCVVLLAMYIRRDKMHLQAPESRVVNLCDANSTPDGHVWPCRWVIPPSFQMLRSESTSTVIVSIPKSAIDFGIDPAREWFVNVWLIPRPETSSGLVRRAREARSRAGLSESADIVIDERAQQLWFMAYDGEPGSVELFSYHADARNPNFTYRRRLNDTVVVQIQLPMPVAWNESEFMRVIPKNIVEIDRKVMASLSNWK
jgi:hypothetical protein